MLGGGGGDDVARACHHLDGEQRVEDQAVDARVGARAAAEGRAREADTRIRADSCTVQGLVGGASAGWRQARCSTHEVLDRRPPAAP